MKQWHDILKDVMNSPEKQDRTKVGTFSKSGTMATWDLSEGFPVVTTKKFFTRSSFGECLWMLRGLTDTTSLREITYGSNSDKKTIWDENYEQQGKDLGYENGELGPIYGKQWRNFYGIDQLQEVIDNIKKDPYSRRHIVTAWNPAELDQMAVPPCHIMFQFLVNNNKLDCIFYMRSTDMFLGFPFDVANYALITHIVANICGLEVGSLVYMGGDCHVYKNSIDACNEVLLHIPHKLPTLSMPDIKRLDELKNYTPLDFTLVGYTSEKSIQVQMAV